MDRACVTAVSLVLLRAFHTSAGSTLDAIYDDISESHRYNRGPIFPPTFTSVAGSHTAKNGDTVVLPCAVKHLGGNSIIWMKDNKVLTADGAPMREKDRLSVAKNNHDLVIKSVAPDDTGVYTCSVALDNSNLEQMQTLDVQYGPDVRTVPEAGVMVVDEGQSALLLCTATGNPAPTVKWRKKVPGAEVHEGSELSLTDVTRTDGGVYQCIADNGAGDTGTADVSLQVLYKPEVEVEQSTVNTGEGFKVQLACIVHSDPIAEVKWSRQNSPLDMSRTSTTNDVTITTRHVLSISDVRLNDFDTYTCKASNQLGSAHGKIKVSGLPEKVEVLSNSMAGDAECYDIAWRVKSFSPVTEYKITYGKAKLNGTGSRPGRWKEVLVPTTGQEPQNDIFFQQQVTLKRLEPATSYDLYIQARNKYGWSLRSDTFHFSTIGRALESRSLANSRGSRLALLTHLYFLLVSVLIRTIT